MEWRNMAYSRPFALELTNVAGCCMVLGTGVSCLSFWLPGWQPAWEFLQLVAHPAALPSQPP